MTEIRRQFDFDFDSEQGRAAKRRAEKLVQTAAAGPRSVQENRALSEPIEDAVNWITEGVEWSSVDDMQAVMTRALYLIGHLAAEGGHGDYPRAQPQIRAVLGQDEANKLLGEGFRLFAAVSNSSAQAGGWGPVYVMTRGAATASN